MAVILIEQDPFIEASLAKDTENDKEKNVRRPLYGICVKENRWAYISVLQSDGTRLTPISTYDSSAPGGRSNANHNFILQEVAERRDEKVQIVETFGDHFAFFYGQRPVILQCSGMLINTPDFNWKNEWLRNYDQFLRGTKCVENRARVFLGFDDVIVQGYILNTAVSVKSDIPYLCPFVFQLLVTGYQDLSQDSGDYVSKAEEGRALVDDSGALVEYFTETSLPWIYEIDPATGESVQRPASVVSAIPLTLTDSGSNAKSADWVGDVNASFDQIKTADQALDYIDAQITAQQNGTDFVTALLAQRQGTQLPLGTREGAAKVSSAFTDLGNAAGIIDDAPVL